MSKWFDHVSIMVLENTGWSSVQSLAFYRFFKAGGTIFTNYTGVTHPSGPNYRAWLSGNTWSGNEFDGVKRPNLGDAVDFRIIEFRGTVADRHNPFKDMRSKNYSLLSTCKYSTDNLKPLVYLSMDDENNAHSGPLSVADNNVMEAVNKFLGLDSNSKLFILIFDEAFGLEYASNHVFAGMIGSGVRGKLITSRLNHYNLAQFLSDNFAAPLSDSSNADCLIYKGQSILEIP